ncbi:MAG: GNAT family N-acetyltransferase [Acidobacteriota bacterium]|jgi:ribosomal-protein-alanine N-acetyltransferase|nr:GNAT family N-acetyltransferase [Acidobacteriota bacterium]
MRPDVPTAGACDGAGGFDDFADIRVSTLLPEDAPLIEALEAATNLSFWGEDNYRRFLGELPEYFGRKLARRVAGATRLVGFSLARAVYENLELLKIGVLPEFHRLGLGTRVLEATFEEGVRRGCDRCFLEVRKSNRRAIQFYGAHGFQIAGARLDYYSNPTEDAWVMELRL